MPRPPPRFPAPDRPCPHTIIAVRAAPIAGALAGAALAGYLLPGRSAAARGRRCAAPLGVEDRTASGRGFALTFDDGPHPQGTPGGARDPRREGVRATFFLVGEQVRRNPALAREIVAAGHGVGLHCDRHRNLLRLTPVAGARGHRARAATRSRPHGGRAPRLYRPPYGVLNAAALRARAARAAGGRCCGATGAGTGRRARRPASIAARVTRRRGARARCCCCTTPTTTPRRAPGGAPPRRCRACSRRSPRGLRPSRLSCAVACAPAARARASADAG